jgi:two-component system alkaline phosphatase synthesis response regulator PhoP
MGTDPMAKVLIVDDSEAFRRLNAELLKMDGHQVLMARNGRETLDLVRTERPDILLLDIMMPGIDGYQVCRQIKGDPDLKATIVVMVTAISQSARYRSLQAGADQHITKPISAREMREMVRSFAQRKTGDGRG